MRDYASSLFGALERDAGGIAIVWYPDLGMRDWLVGEAASFALASANPLRTTSVEEAVREPDRLVLLVPADEVEAVLDLDASRDRLLAHRRPRTQPILLFLLRDGDGARALAERAPGLRSWTSGSDADPEALAAVDPVQDRERFARKVGSTPEDWVAKWRRGEIPWTGDSISVAYWAMLLERR
ncbi:MAG: hypothetical protein FJZ01_13130 [Candidatus Sericytochromatia bacterium]|nr:hypothetical protein [Candidatus Tanganyikabacteria bacterium]